MVMSIYIVSVSYNQEDMASYIQEIMKGKNPDCAWGSVVLFKNLESEIAIMVNDIIYSGDLKE